LRRLHAHAARTVERRINLMMDEPAFFIMPVFDLKKVCRYSIVSVTSLIILNMKEITMIDDLINLSLKE